MNQHKTNLRWSVLGLMLGLLMSALDQTIVSTAMPTIVAEFGEMEKFIWVFSAYLIASVTAMPIFGKLSDMYGRKLFYLIGLGLFITGSALCGTAENMLQLILYRAIQGIGGGALMPITFTIIFDIFPPEKRGKMQGLFGSVFGLSSVLGPIAGGLITEYWHWSWIFYINLPLGVVAFFLILANYHESLEHKEQKIDWLGTITLAVSIVSLMFVLELGGKEFAWSSWQAVGLFAVFAVFLLLFLAVEKRAKDPIVPLSLFGNRLFTASMGVSFFFGAIMISGASYIPMFIQGVFAGSALNASTVLTPMMLAVVVSSSFGGAFFASRTSYRNVMLGSAVLLLTAVLLLGTISVATPRWLITIYMILVGLGIGASFPIISMSSLHRMPFQLRGTVNSLVTSFRTIGSAIGVAIFGALQTNHLTDTLQRTLTDPAMAERFSDARVLLQPEVRATIPKPIYEKMTAALAESIAFLFQWSTLFVVLSLVFIFMMGHARLDLSGRKPGPQGQPGGHPEGSTPPNPASPSPQGSVQKG